MGNNGNGNKNIVTFLAIDNGSSGSLTAIYPNGEVEYHQTPVKVVYNYTKEKHKISRVDFPKLYRILNNIKNKGKSIKLYIERPMVNPMRFKASASALRCLESTLIAIEVLNMPYEFKDSKEWQKGMLPHGIKGSEELKKASKQIASQLFPQIKTKKDGDSLLMAEYFRRANLGLIKK